MPETGKKGLFFRVKKVFRNLDKRPFDVREDQLVARVLMAAERRLAEIVRGLFLIGGNAFPDQMAESEVILGVLMPLIGGGR